MNSPVPSRFLGAGPGAGTGIGPKPAPSPPQNERENTSYDVATLQDEEGELSDFPGEPPPPSSLCAPLSTLFLGPPPGNGALTHRQGESLKLGGRSAPTHYSFYLPALGALTPCSRPPVPIPYGLGPPG